jgi:hypothetical protein
MTDWKNVAQVLKAHRPKAWYRGDEKLDFNLAIELCERMARGELVERSQQDELRDAAADAVDCVDEEDKRDRLRAALKELEQ